MLNLVNLYFRFYNFDHNDIINNDGNYLNNGIILPLSDSIVINIKTQLSFRNNDYVSENLILNKILKTNLSCDEYKIGIFEFIDDLIKTFDNDNIIIDIESIVLSISFETKILTDVFLSFEFN